MHRKRILGRFAVESFVVLSLFLGVFLAQAAPVSAKVCCACKKTTAPGATLCLTGEADTCGELVSQSGSPALSDVTCRATSLSDSQCDRLTQGGAGICTGRPINVTGIEAISPNPKNAPATSDADSGPIVSKTDIYPPKLNVPIPGLQFATRVILDGGQAVIPFMSQYISAVYRYLLGIVVLTAAIALIYGGFHYILGTTLSSIERGKEIIRDAIIGLVMVFSSHLILITLNPALVDFKGLKVEAVSQTAYADLQAEHARVQESATVPAQTPGQGIEVPVFVENSGTPTQPPQLVPGDTSASGLTGSGTTAPVNGTQHPPGTVVKDAKGNFVAQGSCPSDMVPIPYSTDYEKKRSKKVASFCMDVYEAPNQPGVKPYQMVSQFEADWYCAAQGKRLCADSEWTRACLGPTGENLYQYGPKMVNGVYQRVPGQYQAKKTTNPPAPCNYDNNPAAPTPFKLTELVPPLVIDAQHPASPLVNANTKILGLLTKEEYSFFPPGHSSLLRSSDPATAKAAQLIEETIARARTATGLAQSGSRPTCFTSEGVADLSGNAQEIILTDQGAQLTVKDRTAKRGQLGDSGYVWANFYYFPIAHVADVNADPLCTTRWGGNFHNVLEVGGENSFRCCMPLQENP